ncbi:MAG TPA: hypothetical protein DE060_17625 [Lentisphaeria bacterium]|nr:hypothetical protein [Lentisphaeria bacterium]HCG51012.1 hypothetical protein [Lentisphaeria bacterium]
MMKTKSVGALTMRGFMICLHQMHDFMPWFGPNLRGIETILDAMADSKLNTLLFEYEAYFPWSGGNRRICASNAFSETDIAAIQSMAKERGIEIIPLVQVLGHVYHILIHPEYAACAEDSGIPQQLCPLSKETRTLARQLIDDIIRLHPGLRYIHLGGDECEQLGHCPRCAAYAKEHGLAELFLSYMRFVTDYALSKGVTPILWHDIALRHPECLAEFDERVIFEFWNYGDASHGSPEIPFRKLLGTIPANRVIVSPGARAEKQHGALHHSAALVEANIREMNALATDAGALGTILTDWPDTGCSFFDSFYALRVQGAASSGQSNSYLFRREYAERVFGVSAPELPAYLDSIAGLTAFAPGFQSWQRHPLNRYDRAPYDFDQLLRDVLCDYAECNGEYRLYELIARWKSVQYFAEMLAACQPGCRQNETEFAWYSLLAELTEMFLLMELGVLKECFVRKYFDKVSDEILVRFQSREFLRRALTLRDKAEADFRTFYKPYTSEECLDRYCKMLFNQGLKDGLQKLLESPDEVNWTRGN